MLMTYIKCLFKETKEVIDKFGVFQSAVTTLASLIAYYFAFNLIDHIKPYQVEITSSIVVVLLFIGGYMAWKKEYEQIQESLAAKKNNIVFIESVPVWFQIGSAVTSVNIKTIRVYFKFNFQNHKNHTVKIESIDLSEFENALIKKAPKMVNFIYQKILPIEINAKSPNSIEFHNEYDLSKLSFQDQLNFLEELSSTSYTISFKVYSVDGREDVETQLHSDFNNLISSKQIRSYKFNKTVISYFTSKLTNTNE